uniref:E3 ubiquitin-protein ligase RMA n=1 Tax=Opuntia streptacantha TaxID=393608 RepID=A0A7C8ZPA1_OPUST
MEHYFQQPTTLSESIVAEAAGPKNSSAGGFDCNICLESVGDPVVTFCGHLYCWPCLYRWIHSQKASCEDPEQQPRCPVCKAEVSDQTLTPIYGRGQSGKTSNGKGAQNGPTVPHRPNGPKYGVHTLVTASTTSSSSHLSQQHHHDYRVEHGHPYSFRNYPPLPSFGFEGTTTFHPMIGMFSEMIYARIFGNSESTLFAYPNTYSAAIIDNARARRHVMQVDKSLGNFCFFLCCCIILCLLLF